MPSSIHLQIPTPCHEDWNAMSVQKQGRHCASCEKTVVDFSNMSTDAIVAYFNKKQSDSVCGRFSDHHLNQDLIIPKKKLPLLKYFFQVVVPGFLFSAKLHSQSTDKLINQINIPLASNPANQTLGFVSVQPDSLIRIRGRLLDENGSLIPFATIQLKDTRNGVATDSLGNFIISVPQNDSAQLVISALGYIGKTVVVDHKIRQASAPLKIQLQKEEVVLMGAVVITKSRKRKSIPLLTQKLMDTLPSKFRLFPNPLPSGGSLNMELNGIPEAYYLIDILNQTGASMFQKKVWIDAEAKVINFEIPVLSAGVYFVTMRDKKSGKHFSQQLLIQ